MRIRRLAPAAVAAILPLTLAACGGASVEDFCEQYQAIDQLEEADADQAKGRLEELADNVPDEAGDEVQDAVGFLAENFPADGDIEGAVGRGDLSAEEAERFGTAGETVASYGEENCGS